MAGYHSFELCYLAAVYINLLIKKEPLDLYFNPKPGAFPGNILRVAPDILPAGSIRIDEVWLNGQSYGEFDAEALTVNLPTDQKEMKIRVRVMPAGVNFDIALTGVVNDIAKFNLSGSLDDTTLKYFKEEIEKQHGIKGLELNMTELTAISSEALRYLIFYKQKAGAYFSITIIGASGEVLQAIKDSELNEEVTLA